MTTTGKQIFTTLESDGTLTVEVATSEFPEPKGNQVLVKMEAAPINPSDLALLFGQAALDNADYSEGKIVAKMFQREPAIQARRDLRRFKQLMETGEVATSANRKSA